MIHVDSIKVSEINKPQMYCKKLVHINREKHKNILLSQTKNKKFLTLSIERLSSNYDPPR